MVQLFACISNQYCDTTSIQLQCALIRKHNSYITNTLLYRNTVLYTYMVTQLSYNRDNNRNNIATAEQCVVECVIQAKNKGKENKKEVFSVTEES